MQWLLSFAESQHSRGPGTGFSNMLVYREKQSQ
jgi:hypothetical protein